MERAHEVNQYLIPEEVHRLIRDGFRHSLPDGRLHFAAHSHHPWPDVTQSAQLESWKDSVRMLDSKWNSIFSITIPNTKKKLCKLLSIPSHSQVVEGTSSFELVSRVISSFDLSKPLRILTTDSEFYSFERFARRLEELPNIEIHRVPSAPYETFEERFLTQFNQDKYDIVFASLVFFNSGFYADRLLDLLVPIADRTTVIVDAYHAIGALPLDLSIASQKCFIVGGGYKYLGAGEGVCFLVVPPNTQLRPMYTGWLAEYGALDAGLGERVGYADNASRFAGATYDPTGWYRLGAVLDWWESLGLTVEMIHRHARKLQNHFLGNLSSVSALGYNSRTDWGNFLAIPVAESAQLAEKLRSEDVFVDARDGFLRIGFGYYQSLEEVNRMANGIRHQLS